MRRGRRAVLVLAGALLALLAAWGQEGVQRRGFSVKITSPVKDELVLGKSRLTAEVKAPDPAEVERVEFLVNDAVVFVDREPPWECSFDFGETSKSWIVKAVAWHREGFSASATVVTRKIDISYVEEVNRVILWATVTTKKGVPVPALQKSDFRVFENDAPQTIEEFYPEDRPVTLALILDSSGSMREQLKDAQEAAGGFVDALGPLDQALVMDFDDRVFLIQDLTQDKAALREAATSTEALGGTALYDALHAAFRKLRGIEGRKAIVLLSDGDDSASQVTFERILEEAKGEGILIYPIGLGGAVRKGVLKELGDVTGGRSFFVGKAAELAEAYGAIAEELRRQYYLTYESRNETYDGRWIEIRVEGTNPEWVVRARRGYFAVGGSGVSSGIKSSGSAR